MEKETSWCLIPPFIWESTEINLVEKCLLGRIHALQDSYGYCFASNEYLALQLGRTPGSISNIISKLVKKGYLTREVIYKEGTKEVEKRILTLLLAPQKNGYPPHKKMDTLPIKKWIPPHKKMEDRIDLEGILEENINIHKKFSSIKDLGMVEFEEIAKKYEVSVSFVQDCWDSALNWLESTGKKKKNYKAFLANWVKTSKTKKDTDQAIIKNLYDPVASKKEMLQALRRD